MNSLPKLSFLCPIPWSDLKATDVSRYCAACGHTIHNLSALTARQRGELIGRAGSEKICGAYFVRLSGGLVTPDAPLSSGEARSLKQVGAAALSAAALALASGCVTQSALKKVDSPRRPTDRIESKAQPADKEEVVFFVGFIVDPGTEYSPAKPKEKN